MRFSSGGEPQKRVEIKEKRKPRNVFAIVGESVHVIVCQKAICKCIEKVFRNGPQTLDEHEWEMLCGIFFTTYFS